jgi:triacylglycerol lipase
VNSPHTLRRATVAAALALLTVLAVTSGPATARTARTAPAAPGRDPVVFVHGWNSDASVWNTMAGRFRADGWPADRLRQWSYPSHQSNARTAEQLAQEIDRILAETGAARVDLVTHSMGSLPSRHYLKNLTADTEVDAWVSLSGPNHGTNAAFLCGGDACTEMRPGSAFLTALNSGDETPGSPRYATWRSTCDIIVPESGVPLVGAANHLTSCLQHTQFTEDAAVYEEVKQHIS